MNWAAFAAIASVIGLVATIGTGVFLGGKLTQQVQDNGQGLKDLRLEHGTRLDVHDGKINEHDVSIGRLHEWKDGFNAGARKLGTAEVRD